MTRFVEPLIRPILAALHFHRALRVAGIPGLAEAAAERQRREAEVAQLAWLLSLPTNEDRLAEARRALALADAVGTAEAQVSPNATTSARIADYRRAVIEMAKRGEPLPQTEVELREIPEAQAWRARDAARAAALLL